MNKIIPALVIVALAAFAGSAQAKKEKADVQGRVASVTAPR